MQRSLLSNRDRTAALLAVLLVHAGLALLILNASGQVDLTPLPLQVPIETFDVIEPPPPEPPPPPPPPPRPSPEAPRPKAQPREEGAAAPPNIRSKATPVVLPKPVIELPQAPKVVASETPAQGTQATQGAAPVPGPGTGAGGVGTGTGSGGSGSGTGGGGGGGGGGGTGTRPSVIQSTTLTGRDYPLAVLRAWPRRGRTFVAVRVQLDGRATDCKVNRSSGNPVVDEWTCRLVEQKVRFRPAVNERGQPYVAWYGYVQAPVNF